MKHELDSPSNFNKLQQDKKLSKLSAYGSINTFLQNSGVDLKNDLSDNNSLLILRDNLISSDVLFKPNVSNNETDEGDVKRNINEYKAIT